MSKFVQVTKDSLVEAVSNCQHISKIGTEISGAHFCLYFTGKKLDQESLIGYSAKPELALVPVFYLADWYLKKVPLTKEDEAVGRWLSAALDDPKTCDEMKADINRWMDSKEYPKAKEVKPFDNDLETE